MSRNLDADGRGRTGGHPADIPPNPRRHRLGLALFLVTGCLLWAQWPVLSARALMFDDAAYLVENRLVRNPSLDSIARFFGEVLEPSTVRGYYQPLAMTSLMVDCGLGGSPENLAPFRRTSLIIHLLTTLLVGALFFHTFNCLPAALFGALAFGLHPGCVESTAWLSDRKTLLAGLFCVASLVCYAEYARQGGRRRYVGILVFYLLALLSKPTATTLPLVMLVMDFWPFRRLNVRTIREKLPFFALAITFAVITYVSQSRTAGVIAPESYTLTGRALIVGYNLAFYPLHFFWPVDLSGHYPYPNPVNMGNPAVRRAILLSLLVIGLSVLSLKWTRSIMAGLLIAVFALLPAIGVIGFTPAIAADRFAYIARLGFLLPAVFAVSVFWPLIRDGRPAIAFAFLLILATPLVAEGLLTRRYLAEWSDTERFARYMVVRAPESSYLRTNLGKILAGSGRQSEAIEQFEAAIRLGKEPDAHAGLAVPLAAQGRMDQAEEHLREAVRLDPANPITQGNLALILQHRGRPRDALPYFERALLLHPGSETYCLRLADAYLAAGRRADAVEVLERTQRHLASSGESEGAERLRARIAAIQADHPTTRPDRP